MRQIKTVANQTVFDIAVQEYGNVEAVFQIFADNNLEFKNDFPTGSSLPFNTGFDISFPFLSGITLNISENIQLQNLAVNKQLSNVIS